MVRIPWVVKTGNVVGGKVSSTCWQKSQLQKSSKQQVIFGSQIDIICLCLQSYFYLPVKFAERKGSDKLKLVVLNPNASPMLSMRFSSTIRKSCSPQNSTSKEFFLKTKRTVFSVPGSMQPRWTARAVELAKKVEFILPINSSEKQPLTSSSQVSQAILR